MKACSLNEFLEELKPWLDSDHIHSAEVDANGHFVLHFTDGMKNVYALDDCNQAQVQKVMADLAKQGIKVKS